MEQNEKVEGPKEDNKNEKPSPVHVQITPPTTGETKVQVMHPDASQPDLHVTVAAPVKETIVPVLKTVSVPTNKSGVMFVVGIVVVLVLSVGYAYYKMHG